MSTRTRRAPERRDEVEQRIFVGIRQLIASVILFNHEVAERLRLGPSDGQFMTLLEQHGPLTPGRLAALSGLGTGTVTGVIDRLERAGYVHRERDPADRRKVIVSRDEERIQREIAPLYAGQAEGLAKTLERYDTQQLEVIADFLAAVTR